MTMPVSMTSLEIVRMDLIEAVSTSNDRSEDEQRRLIADLLAIAFAANRPRPLPAA